MLPLGRDPSASLPVSPAEKKDSPRRAKNRELPEPEGFAEFWTLYPRKVGRRSAMAAYRVALRSISSADLNSALRARVPQMEAKIDNTLDDPKKFIKHPATWLNSEGWNDEVVKFQPTGKHVIYGATRGDRRLTREEREAAIKACEDAGYR